MEVSSPTHCVGGSPKSSLYVLRPELLEEAYLRIGRVLFYCPQDPDGLLIHRTAAAALDEGDAKEMRRGYYHAITDSRGVHEVDGTGKQERDLAEQYRQKAEKIENAGYPLPGRRIQRSFRTIRR